MLEGAFRSMFEIDASRPFFQPIGTRTRKMLGDNADALYYTAPVRADMRTASPGTWPVASTSRSRWSGTRPTAGTAPQTAGVLRDADFDFAPDGSFEIFFGGPSACEPTGSRSPRARPSSSCVATSRKPTPTAADVNRRRATDDRADRARRVRRRRGTTRRSRRAGAASPRSCAPGRSSRRSRVNACSRRGSRPRRTCSRRPSSRATFAFAAADAAYSMAPYLLAPDEALVITGRWPRVPVRERRVVEPLPADLRLRAPARGPATARTRSSRPRELPHGARPRGSGRAELDRHRGPRFRIVFWRFFMPEGDVETPQATVVKLADVQ